MGIKWVNLDSVQSTNSYISLLLKQGRIHEELLVTADYQERGRGQGEHAWHSEKGKNLLMSLLLYPAFLSASEQFQLSSLASLSICDVLEEEGLDPLIKWPNDILTPGGKVAGILIEHGITGSKISHTIIGIGLNLNQTIFPTFPLSASSLKLEKGITRDPKMMAERIAERIMTRYDWLRTGNVEVMQQEYMQRLYSLDQPAIYSAGGLDFQGLIRGVNEYGELLVETKGKIKSFGQQEIKYILPGA